MIRHAVVGLAARAEDGGEDVAEDGAKSGRGGSEDGGADLEEGPVGCVDVVPVGVRPRTFGTWYGTTA